MTGTDALDRNSARMNFRTRPHVKDAIRQAARLVGMDDSTFALGAAYRAAIETIERHENTRLADADHASFFEAIDSPSPPTGRLREAFERHREMVAKS